MNCSVPPLNVLAALVLLGGKWADVGATLMVIMTSAVLLLRLLSAVGLRIGLAALGGE